MPGATPTSKMERYNLLIERYEIPSINKGKQVINCPYTPVLDRTQVIENDMVGWASAKPTPKKHAFEVGSSSNSASKRRNVNNEDIDL